jgi:hypothetical protein
MNVVLMDLKFKKNVTGQIFMTYESMKLIVSG